VRAAALQGEFDRLFRLTFHPTSPDRVPRHGRTPRRDRSHYALECSGLRRRRRWRRNLCKSLVCQRIVANHRFFPARRENTAKIAIARSIGGETELASLCYFSKPSVKFPRRSNRENNQPNREPNRSNREASENHQGCSESVTGSADCWIQPGVMKISARGTRLTAPRCDLAEYN
jgi:hypothetical protein